MKRIVIGRAGNQPFIIKDEYVSREHAIFTYDETTGLMTLTDNSRAEAGTFVRMGNQFIRISQCNVDATTGWTKPITRTHRDQKHNKSPHRSVVDGANEDLCVMPHDFNKMSYQEMHIWNLSSMLLVRNKVPASNEWHIVSKQ